MRLFLFILSLCFSLVWQDNAYATRYTGRSIKKYVEKTPRENENSISSLVNYLVDPLDDDYDKARAIAFWIASRISYDEFFYIKGKTTKLIKSYQGQTPQELLKSRAGICGDFARLFQEMCERAGIRAYIIHGYAYPSSSTYSRKHNSNTGHAWNYFKYHGKKIYVDTTFMAKGSISSPNRVGNLAHKRALRELKQNNKYKSQIHDFDDYYFNFIYKNEIRDKGYTHQEQWQRHLHHFGLSSGARVYSIVANIFPLKAEDKKMEFFLLY